ncbi:MAG TPA: TonB-dependent receptor [candidate division Zixibacteria bacterium]|nr:TonB-dependent receptor [candidate division Zixibacteria bacterium]
MFLRAEWRIVTYILAAVFLVTAANVLAFPSAGSNGVRVEGVVLNEAGQPVGNATVNVPALDRTVRTDSDGRFMLANLPDTKMLVEVSYVGYVSATVEVQPGDEPITVKLKERAIELGRITVTGSPNAADPLATPQDIQVMSGQALTANETASLGKVLENLPGVSSISTGPEAGKPVIRGLSGNRIRVMKDGVPMEHFQFSFRHQPVLNVSQAERVEVIQGAASILYGSDALGGVANVITKRLPSSQPGLSYMTGQVKGQYFSNNKERAGTVELEGASGMFGYRAGWTSRKADDFSTPEAATYAETGEAGTPKFTGKLPYTNFDQISGYAVAGLTGSFGNLWAEYDRYDSEQNYLLGDGSPIGQNLENDNLKLRGNFLLSPKVVLKPTLSFQRNVRQAKEGVSFEDDPDWAVDLVRTVYVARFDLVHNAIAGLNGTVGIDLNVQNQDTRASGLLPDADIMDIGVYAFEEHSWRRLTLNGGLRFDYRKHDADANPAMNLPDTAAGETDDVLKQDYSVMSGSAGVSYRLTENLTAASNLSIGFRAPDLFELHANGVHGGVQAFQVGDPYLDPERSYNIDAGLRLRTERVLAHATVYYNRIDNYIFLRNTGLDTTIGTTTLPILKADQTDGTITGVELSLEADLLSWLRLSTAYAALTSDNKETGEELPLMPADRLTAGLRFNLPGKGILRSPFAEVRVKHAWAKESAGTYEPFSQFDVIAFGTASTDAYTVLNLAFGATLSFEGQPITVNLEIENALDEEYVDFLDTYKGYALSMGRNVSLRLTAPFRIM